MMFQIYLFQSSLNLNVRLCLLFLLRDVTCCDTVTQRFQRLDIQVTES